VTTGRRALTAGLGVVVCAVLAGCTSGPGGEPEERSDAAVGVTAEASGTSPVVFAFVCSGGVSDETETYTTYSAVWDDERTACTAERITGTEMSSQQRSAVAAAEGDATLEELAADCAVRGTGPWVEPVDSATAARVGESLLRYCPGHPETSRLRAAVAAWRG
jgi:hypothetical protein